MSNAGEAEDRRIKSANNRARLLGVIAALAGSGSNPLPARRGTGLFSDPTKCQRGIQVYREKRKKANKLARKQRRVNRLRG